jgi:GNAT superfamily N-acetyltransferase
MTAHLALDRLIEAISHLYGSVPAATPVGGGALHHIRYGQPAFEIGITDEFFVIGAAPKEAVLAVRCAQAGSGHCLTVFGPAPEIAVLSYADLGYRPVEQLFLMARSPIGPPASQTGLTVRQVKTPAEQERINACREKQVIKPEHLADPAVAHYYADLDGQPVASGILVLADRTVAYIADMFTRPQYRGCGIASALLQRMLADAAAAGAQRSILLATAAARSIYRRLGYEDLALAQVFVPA